MGREVVAEPAAERILGRLVAAPSAQTSLFESDPGIQSYLKDTVAPLMRELDLRPEFDAMGNLFTRAGRAGGARVLLFGYAMTHPANRMLDPFTPRSAAGPDGRVHLRGRGAAEQKAAATALLLAAAELRHGQPELDGEVVVCISTAGETGRHDAARALLAAAREPRFEWAIVGIGTDNKIGLGNKGRLDVSVRVRGRAAHSSTPWAGLDAVRGAREVMERLDRVALPGRHPQLGSPTLTVTSIRSFPEATHTVQDEVLLTLDRRLLPGDDPERALGDLRSAAAGLDGWEVELAPGPFMYPSEVAPDAPLVRLLQDAAAEIGLGPLGELWSHGAIDAGFFNHEGIPAVMFGPGAPAMFHTDEESVALEDVTAAARLYEVAARKQLMPRRRSR